MPDGIRPTQDKVRKALFDILGDMGGLSFLELFAGSGAVGLEALSQGAALTVFVESDHKCAQAIRENISKVTGNDPYLAPGAAAKGAIVSRDVHEAIVSLHDAAKVFDIIFIDPPYYKNMGKKALQTLVDYDILAPTGLIVVQHFKKDDLPDALGVLTLFKNSTYGDTALSFYKKNVPESDIPGDL